jgi:predicted outer membrane lipoprotein
VLIFAAGVIVTWRRGAGSMALVLTAGFAVVNALALTILAFEKETELRLVIDFLTGA